MAQTFAEMVKAQRGPLPGGRHRFTQHHCAQKVPVHVSTWRAWETGKRCPRVDEALAFADAFRLDENDVFKGIAAQEGNG